MSLSLKSSAGLTVMFRGMTPAQSWYALDSDDNLGSQFIFISDAFLVAHGVSLEGKDLTAQSSLI